MIGKVTDAQGNGVPGATIVPDSGGSVTVSLGQGGYRLNNLTGNVVHHITASVQQGSTQYTGSTQVLTQSGFLVSNANILLSPADRQATVSGTVTDTSGNPSPASGSSWPCPTQRTRPTISSLIAFTDANGAYTIPNIPIRPAHRRCAVTITASTPGAQNQTFTLAGVPAGRRLQPELHPEPPRRGTALAAPAILSVTTATEPTDFAERTPCRPRVAGAAPPRSMSSIRRRLVPRLRPHGRPHGGDRQAPDRPRGRRLRHRDRHRLHPVHEPAA